MTTDPLPVNTEPLTIFAFDSAAVRTTTRQDQPWFVAKDICAILEIENTSHAVSKLDEDEKGIIISETLGGNQETLIVSESGLYHLVFKSRKKEAKAFRKWVTSEVLPQIRQTGHYRHTPQPAAVSIPEQYVTLTHFDASIAIIDQNTKALQACALGLTNALQRITALETRQAKLENALRQIQTSVTQALSLFHTTHTPSLRN